MAIKTLIVDDEPLARAGLRLLLSQDPEISEISEAAEGRQAVNIIRDRLPDLVFLDVQMPETDGFAVIREVGHERMPETVFVTAHDQYAIQAFEMNALDYLLKPVAAERFLKALARCKVTLALKTKQDLSQQYFELLDGVARRRRFPKRLAVKDAGKAIFVDLENVDWIEGAENYAQLHVGKTSHLVHVPMHRLAGCLDPETFVRVHRSIIVNVKRIREVHATDHGEYVIVLSGGVQLQSGRTYRERLKDLMSNPF